MNLLYVTGDTTTDAKTIPIHKTTGESLFPNLYAVELNSVPPGALVLITAQVEITSPVDYNVGCGTRIVCINPADGSERTILPAAMMNITPAEHHTIRSFAVWDVPGIANPVYALDGYAAASKVKSGDTLKVEEGCGLMQCAVFVP